MAAGLTDAVGADLTLRNRREPDAHQPGPTRTMREHELAGQIKTASCRRLLIAPGSWDAARHLIRCDFGRASFHQWAAMTPFGLPLSQGAAGSAVFIAKVRSSASDAALVRVSFMDAGFSGASA